MNPAHNISKVNKKALDQVNVNDPSNPIDPIDPIDPNNKFLKGGSMNNMLEIGAGEPEPKRMFGPLWIEGEVAIFYATSKVGKTVLAYQVANAIANGENVFPNNTELSNYCKPKRVLYVDAELKVRQITGRYSEPYGQNLFQFSDNFFRIGKGKGFRWKKGDDLVEVINTDIKTALIEYKAEVLIIDNLSVLGNGIESSKEAMPLMLTLLNWNVDLDISIMVIGHTTKTDPFTKIEKSNLQGSAMIGNMFESIIAMNRCSGDENKRYIKAIDFRSEKEDFGANRVIVCNVEKPSNCLKWTFEGYDQEDNLLLEFNAEAKAETRLEIIKWYFEGYDKDDHPEFKKGMKLSAKQIVPMVAYKLTTVKQIIADEKLKRGSTGSIGSDKSATSTKTEQLKAI
tara:strand:+ start:2041 stop:3234 length:1194 start_codon:yes stop_codon:yes gene_type:complete